MDVNKLCMGCMEDDSGDPICPKCGRPADLIPKNSMQMKPRTILRDQYLIGRALGHGGFGITYLAWDIGLETRLAVKEYMPNGVAGRASGDTRVLAFSDQTKIEFDYGLDRFLEEARVLKKFRDHPGIVSIDTIFRDNGTAYLVMEFLDGMTFEEFLKRRGGKVTVETALRVMLPVMDALTAVHAEGILHRDISPDNIHLARNGKVKLIDFGAARNALGQKSRNLSIILKEGYAPEEQYRASGIQGPWTDVYATAATLYHALTGQAPQPALDRQAEDRLEPPSKLEVIIDPNAEAALMKALAVRAADRFPSMEDFKAAVTGLVEVSAGATRKVDRDDPRIRELEQAAMLHTPGGRPQNSGIAPPLGPPPPPPALPMGRMQGPPPPPPAVMTQRGVGQTSGRPRWMLPAGLGGAAVVAVLAAVYYAGQTPAPTISTFGVQPQSVPSGQSATVSWSVANATDVSVDPGIGAVSAEGSRQVSPAATTTYTLTAKGKGGTATRTLIVEVGSAPAPKPGGEGPSISSFGVDVPNVQPGKSATLSWSVANASEISIDPGIGAVAPDGSRQVSPASTTTYTLTAHGKDGTTASRTTTIEVSQTAPPKPGPGQGPTISSFGVEPQSVQPGRPATLTWSVEGAAAVNIDPGIGTVPAKASRQVSPTATTTYTLIASGRGGPVTRTVKLAVTQPGQPGKGLAPIALLSVTPTTIQRGQSASLSWNALNSTDSSIDQGIGSVSNNGIRQVSPATTTTYTLTVRSAAGTDTGSVTLDVTGGGTSVQPPGPGPGGGGGGGAASDSYEGLVQSASQASQRNSYQQAQQMLSRAIAMDANRPEAYDKLGELDLYGLNQINTAIQNYQAAISHGGQATFHVIHDHSAETFTTFCKGFLTVSKAQVRFKAVDSVHEFSAPRAQIREFKRIRFSFDPRRRTLADPKAFHVKLADGRNFNFAPGSHFAEAERDLILSIWGNE